MDIQKILLSSALVGAAFGTGATINTTAHASHVIYQSKTTKVSTQHHHRKTVKQHHESIHQQELEIYGAMASATHENHNTAYDWTNSRTEAGQSPWESYDGSTGDAHQELHNGNQIFYYNGGTGVDRQAIDQAIANWNSLGVVKLVEVNQPIAEIVISNDDYSQDDGHSNYGITPYSIYSNGVMTGAHSYLCRASDHVSYQEKVNIATHEIGHALGFAHDESVYKGPYGQYSTHIMYSGQTDKVLPVSTKEANALRLHYGL